MSTIELDIKNPFQRYMTCPWSKNVKIWLFWAKIMHNYANLCIIMHATYTILFSSLPGIMMKACVKFHLDPINGF